MKDRLRGSLLGGAIADAPVPSVEVPKVQTEVLEDKLIAIGDVHGLSKWRNVIEAHPTASRYVFLGDYCDPYVCAITDEEVVKNLTDIIGFKKKYPERVVLLLGNHDMHYIRPELPKGSRYKPSLAIQLNNLYNDNKELFQFAFACNHLLFTHAGVSRSWFDAFGGVPTKSLAGQINERKDDPLLLQCGFLRGGRSDFGGPLWADIEEFSNYELFPGYIQIVGHNRVKCLQAKGESIASTGIIVFCDSLHYNYFLVVERPASNDPEFYEDNVKRKY